MSMCIFGDRECNYYFTDNVVYLKKFMWQLQSTYKNSGNHSNWRNLCSYIQQPARDTSLFLANIICRLLQAPKSYKLDYTLADTQIGLWSFHFTYGSKGPQSSPKIPSKELPHSKKTPKLYTYTAAGCAYLSTTPFNVGGMVRKEGELWEDVP